MRWSGQADEIRRPLANDRAPGALAPRSEIALGAGILVASVSFSLLTAAASTIQLEVHGTVDAASRPAYDILVRPKGAADAIETQDNLVRDNFLAGTSAGSRSRNGRRFSACRTSRWPHRLRISAMSSRKRRWWSVVRLATQTHTSSIE